MFKYLTNTANGNKFTYWKQNPVNDI